MAHTITTAAPRGLFAALENLRARIDRAMTRRAVYLRTLDELSALTDRELADLGFARCDLPRVASEAAGRA
jgi:uncharacterized protein YjiS (DUF1127 family)